MSSKRSDRQASEAPPRGWQPIASPVFATYIDVYAVEDSEALNLALLAVIADWHQSDNGIGASNELGWHSSRHLFERGEPAFLRLFEHIDLALATSVRRHWKEFNPQHNVVQREGWVNANPKGAFNTVHEHGTFHFSGVYYVAVGETGAGRNGAIEFLNPSGITALPLPNRNYTSSPKIAVIPNSGNLLVFPSYLRHWVYPNQNDQDRVSIAFNFRLCVAR